VIYSVHVFGGALCQAQTNQREREKKRRGERSDGDGRVVAKGPKTGHGGEKKKKERGRRKRFSSLSFCFQVSPLRSDAVNREKGRKKIQIACSILEFRVGISSGR